MLMPSLRLVAALTLLSSEFLLAQTPSNTTLNGKYFARHLLMTTTAAGAVGEMRTFYGSVTFNGVGGYSFLGSQIVGAAAPVAERRVGTSGRVGSARLSAGCPVAAAARPPSSRRARC